MIGTIEELEKEIEKFQNKMLVSGEIVDLFCEILNQIKVQNKEFESKTGSMISELNFIPKAINQANLASNETIKRNVESQLKNTLEEFSKEQGKYINTLEQVKQITLNLIEETKKREELLTEETDHIIAEVKTVPEKVNNSNIETQKSILLGTDKILETRNNQFSKELDLCVDTIKLTTDRLERCQETFETRAEETAKKIKNDNLEIKKVTVSEINQVLEENNKEFTKEQKKYIDEIKAFVAEIESYRNDLLEKYHDFIRTLENTNLSHLHEENQKLRNEMNKKTILLMLLSGASIVLGIIGMLM